LAQREAVRATWKVTREAGTPKLSAKAVADAAKAELAAADDEEVFAFVRKLAMRGESLTRRALRDHDEGPIAVNRITRSLKRLIEVGRLRLVGKKGSTSRSATRG